MNRLSTALGAALLLALPASVAVAQTPGKQAAMIEACRGTDTDDCIVRRFKDTMEASIIRGRIVYRNYCVLCHGQSGEGDGRAAKVHTPKPANLVKSRVPAEYIALIVRKGGEGVSRYKGMPPWGDQLTDEQIRDVVNFLVSIRNTGS